MKTLFWFCNLLRSHPQFRVDFRGKLFFEHLVASLIFAIALVSIPLLISLLLILIFSFLVSIFGENILFYGFFVVATTFRAWYLLIIPLFLLARLLFVFRKDGFIAFCGALFGELIILIPFIGLVIIGTTVIG